MERKFLFGFPITVGPYDKFVDSIVELSSEQKSSYVCVAAVHQLVEAYMNPDYRKISRAADLVTPDGQPINWALRILKGIKQDRVAGPDLFSSLLEEANKRKISLFFYGSTEEMLQKTDEFLKMNYPDIPVAGLYSPPFRNLTQQEEEEVCEMINESKAQIVFVILGCPKQEKWMFSMKNKVNCTMVGIGAALPVIIGLQKRAPMWMQKLGMEWFYRFLHEPKRLWKRYLVTNSIFLYLIVKEKIKVSLRA